MAIWYDKNLLGEMLKTLVANVTFEKADGTKREMRCTLMPQYLPEAKPLAEGKVPRKENPNVLSVWDLDKSGWRSFNLDSIIQLSFEYNDIRTNAHPFNKE